MIKLRMTGKKCLLGKGSELSGLGTITVNTGYAAQLCVAVCMIPVLLLGACATVDLSQVSISAPEKQAAKSSQNVVKQASQKLTRVFTAKGWCKDPAASASQSAASVLLHGRKNVSHDKLNPINPVPNIAADLAMATTHIQQTSKAAEVFLVMAEDEYDISHELSVLETALLSAHQAQVNFERNHGASSLKYGGEFENFRLSLAALQMITDQYGARIRQNIVTDVTLGHTTLTKS